MNMQSSNVLPWHRNTAVYVDGLSLQEQLRAARLDWSVNIGPFRYGDQFQYTDPKVKVAYRDIDGKYIDKYIDRKPWQNREILQHFHDFCNESDLSLKVEYIGSLNKGLILYAAARLPVITDVRKAGDIIEWWLILRDSHMNGSGLKVSLYANRLICTNGMHRLIREGNKVIAHLGEFNKDRINELLGAATRTLRKEEEVYEKLTGVPVTKEEAVMHLINAFGDPKKTIDEQPKPVQIGLRLFEGQAKGSELITAYNTAWGLLNSVSEYFNWHAPSRGSAQTQLNALLQGGRYSGIKKMQDQLVSCYLRS